jgi:hypothetical protein
MSTIIFDTTTNTDAELRPDPLGFAPSIHLAGAHAGGVAIFGAGHAGAAVANALVLLGATRRGELYDRRASRAEAKPGTSPTEHPFWAAPRSPRPTTVRTSPALDTRGRASYSGRFTPEHPREQRNRTCPHTS